MYLGSDECVNLCQWTNLCSSNHRQIANVFAVDIHELRTTKDRFKYRTSLTSIVRSVGADGPLNSTAETIENVSTPAAEGRGRRQVLEEMADRQTGWHRCRPVAPSRDWQTQPLRSRRLMILLIIHSRPLGRGGVLALLIDREIAHRARTLVGHSLIYVVKALVTSSDG